MMDYICNLAVSLRDKYFTHDPFQIAEAMGIELLFHPLGEHLKGYFFYHSKVRIIVINQELPIELQRVVCAHELGHSLLHKELATQNNFQDFSLFDITAKPEYEANLFAAELLLPDDEVMAHLLDGVSLYAIASELYVPPELLSFKLRILQKKGIDLQLPMECRGNFLK